MRLLPMPKLPYFILILLNFVNISQSIYAMQDESESHKPHVQYTPQKGTAPYGGFQHKEGGDETVRVSSCVSLGGSFIDRINAVLRGTDQFVVCFMYRFNSPTLMRRLEDLYQASIPVLTFLDYQQTYESSSEGSKYPNYARRLISSVPTSLVKLGSRAFHQKIIIAKKKEEQAAVIMGSANATFEADNEHSEDIIFIQSNALAASCLAEFEKLFRMEPPKKASSEPFLNNK